MPAQTANVLQQIIKWFRESKRHAGVALVLIQDLFIATEKSNNNKKVKYGHPCAAQHSNIRGNDNNPSHRLFSYDLRDSARIIKW